jgi:hypothetical protein
MLKAPAGRTVRSGETVYPAPCPSATGKGYHLQDLDAICIRHTKEIIGVDPETSYWRRQLYLLSSLGIFYVIIIALFGIPLLATFVVILIKGALDLRYVIIAGGCVGLVVLTVFAVRAVRRLLQYLRQDGQMAGRDIRQQLLLGNPFEVSVLNGLLKFSSGHQNADGTPAIGQPQRPLLPHSPGHGQPADILSQLEHLAELKQSGVIDDDEFKMLKTVLIDSQKATGKTAGNDPA